MLLFLNHFLICLVLHSISFRTLHGSTVTTSSLSVLTTTSPNTSIAEISLVPNNGSNSIVSNAWQCENDDYNSFCVDLRIHNTHCTGIETITIKLYGAQVTSDSDVYAVFSLLNSNNKTQFFSYVNDWDGGWTLYSGATSGGVFIAPTCDTSELFTRNGYIYSLLNDVDTSDIYSNRDYVANGNRYNWEALTYDKVGTNTSPLYYTIVNDIINNKLYTSFYASTLDSEQNCSYSDSFDTQSGNDYHFMFFPDGSTLKFWRFDVQVSCQVPTVAPTRIPSINPTTTPSDEPTQIPSATPSDNPSKMPTVSPSDVTDVPTQSPTTDGSGSTNGSGSGSGSGSSSNNDNNSNDSSSNDNTVLYILFGIVLFIVGLLVVVIIYVVKVFNTRLNDKNSKLEKYEQMMEEIRKAALNGNGNGTGTTTGHGGGNGIATNALINTNAINPINTNAVAQLFTGNSNNSNNSNNPQAIMADPGSPSSMANGASPAMFSGYNANNNNNSNNNNNNNNNDEFDNNMQGEGMSQVAGNETGAAFNDVLSMNDINQINNVKLDAAPEIELEAQTKYGSVVSSASSAAAAYGANDNNNNKNNNNMNAFFGNNLKDGQIFENAMLDDIVSHIDTKQ